MAETAKLYGLAEQLVNNPEQLAVYDQAKWNLLGDADPARRFAGHHPWPKGVDSAGQERTFSVPVFSGFSEQIGTVLVVRKDPWTAVEDPASWRVAQQQLESGYYQETKVLRAEVDAGRRFWLQLAPRNYNNWPPGKHPALHARPADQIRLEGRLDEYFHTPVVEYRNGLRGGISFEDIEALESMIIVVQALRDMEYAEAFAACHREMIERDMAMRSVVLAMA
ncbi:MAG: hypothetical protein WAQ25_02555 [Candidatus Saccharimonas sp.]